MNYFLKKRPVLFLVSVVLTVLMLAGCARGNNTQENTSSPNTNSNSAQKEESKSQPDKLTKVKVAIPSQGLQYLPWFVAENKGFFKKYNLDLELVRVESGILALRGLQSGDFKFATSLPESVIVGAAEGANVKFIGTMTNQSLYVAYVSPEIKKISDLKGKVAGTFQPGNGTDMQLRWWLKKNGLEPDKDIRIISAGANQERFTALKTGNVQVTLITPPYNFEADNVGLKQIAVLRDELKTYNHDTIIANGTVLKKEPEVARAFMKATAEAIDFIKNSANREELIKIGMDKTNSSNEITIKSLDFLLPSFADKAKMIPEGIDWAIATCKDVGVLKKEMSFKDVVDESFYAN